MILADSSVWIDHLRGGPTRPAMTVLLNAEQILVHPFVLGELAVGHLADRAKTLAILGSILQAPVLDDEEILQLVEVRHLAGKGIGWVDAHLLGSALIAGCQLWSIDKALARLAQAAGVAHV